MLAKAAAKGGNLLMNVGPMGNGKIDPIDVKILKGIGDWLKVNGEAIYGVEKTRLPVNAWGETSIRGNNIYCHVFNWPTDKKLIVGGLKSAVNKAYLLEDTEKKNLQVKRLNDLDIVIYVPETSPDTVNTVIVLECKDSIEADPLQLLVTNIRNNRFHVFDGQLTGKAITYGSGNKKDNYIRTWKGMDCFVSWPVRVNKKANFNLKITYSADETLIGNVYNVQIGEQVFEGTVQGGRYKEYKLGQVTLEPGSYEIKVKPKEIKNGDLMHLTKLNLIPVK